MSGNSSQVQFNLQSLKEELNALSQSNNSCLVYLDSCLQKQKRENQQLDIYDVIHGLQITFKQFPKQKAQLRQLQTQMILLNNQDKTGSIKLFTKLLHDTSNSSIDIRTQKLYSDHRKQTQKITSAQNGVTKSQLAISGLNEDQIQVEIYNKASKQNLNKKFTNLNQKDLELAQRLRKLNDTSVSTSSLLANSDIPGDLTVQQHTRMLHLKNFDEGSGYQVRIFLLNQKTKHIREHLIYIIKYIHQIHSQVEVKNRLRKFWLKRRDNLKQKLADIYQQKYNPAQLVMVQYKIQLRMQEIMQLCKLFPLKLTSFKTIQIHNLSLREKQMEYLKFRLQKYQLFKQLNQKRHQNLLIFILKCQIVKRKYIIMKKTKLLKFLKMVHKIQLKIQNILLREKTYQNTFISIYTRTIEQLNTDNSSKLIAKYLQHQKMQNQYELQLKRTKLRRISYRKQKIQNGIKTQTRKYHAIMQTYVRIKINFFQQTQRQQKLIIQYRQSVKNAQSVLTRLFQQKQILTLQIQLQQKQSLMFQNLSHVVLKLHPPKSQEDDESQQENVQESDQINDQQVSPEE